MNNKKIQLFIIFCTVFASALRSQNWLWARSTNGSGYDKITSVSANRNGEIFASGFFFSPYITFNTFVLTNYGNFNSFIVKYNSVGTLAWAQGMTSTARCVAMSVSADENGNVFVGGSFSDSAMTLGNITLARPGFFICKYDVNGNVVWAKDATSGITDGWSVCADKFGNVYATGRFASPTVTFDSTTLFQSCTNGNNSTDIFLVKFDSSGNVLWAKTAGGAGTKGAFSVETDASGNVYVTGSFHGSPISFDSITLSNNGHYDFFLAKFDPDGNILWAKSAGGSNYEIGFALSADPYGNILTTGSFYSTTLSFDSVTLTNAGYNDEFIVKYDSLGNLLWAKSEGGPGEDAAYGLSADAWGNFYLTGVFSDPSITFGNTTVTAPPSSCGGACYPMFLNKYDKNGVLLCASVLPSAGGEANCVSVDPFGNAYVGGAFFSTPLGVGHDTLNLTGTGNAFVAKYICESDAILLNKESDNTIVLLLYPNPSTGIFTIQLNKKTTNTKICVYDVLGNCVLSKITDSETKTIDLSGKAKGIYIAEITFDNKKEIKKIIID